MPRVLPSTKKRKGVASKPANKRSEAGKTDHHTFRPFGRDDEDWPATSAASAERHRSPNPRSFRRKMTADPKGLHHHQTAQNITPSSDGGAPPCPHCRSLRSEAEGVAAKYSQELLARDDLLEQRRSEVENLRSAEEQAMKRLLAALPNELETKTGGTLDGLIDLLEQTLRSQTAQINKYENAKLELDCQVEAQKQEILQLKDALRKSGQEWTQKKLQLQSDIAVKQEELQELESSLEEKLHQAELELVQKESEFETLQARESELQKEKSDLQQQLRQSEEDLIESKLETEERERELRHVRSDLRQKLKRQENQFASDLDLKEKEFQQTIAADVGAKEKELRETKFDFEQKLRQLELERKQQEAQFISDLDTKETEFQKTKQELEQQKTRLEQELRQVKRALKPTASATKSEGRNKNNPSATEEPRDNTTLSSKKRRRSGGDDENVLDEANQQKPKRSKSTKHVAFCTTPLSDSTPSVTGIPIPNFLRHQTPPKKKKKKSKGCKRTLILAGTSLSPVEQEPENPQMQGYPAFDERSSQEELVSRTKTKSKNKSRTTKEEGKLKQSFLDDSSIDSSPFHSVSEF